MPQYDDGLDDDGYPIVSNKVRGYQRGSEADAGDFNPLSIGSLVCRAFERIGTEQKTSVAADSPIETILGAAIIMAFRRGQKPLTLASEPSQEAKGLLLIPQFRWLRYRSDWAIYNPKTTGALLIECDGMAFHSSPDAVKHDIQKDQDARGIGFLTKRFTGSQINRNADQCASEIFNFVYRGRQCS